MPFRVSRQVAISSKRRPRPSESASQPASQSQTKSHGFTYYDLHPCPLPLLRFLLSSRLSPPRPPTLPPLPPPFSRLAPARATSFVSFSRFIFLSRNIHFWYRLEKCHFTATFRFCQVSLFHVVLFAPYSDCLAFASRFLERGTGNSCNSQ